MCDGGARLLALLLYADIGVAPLHYLDQMPAELRLRHTDHAGLQFVHYLFEFGHGLAGDTQSRSPPCCALPSCE